jgi:hypothetical protein
MIMKLLVVLGLATAALGGCAVVPVGPSMSAYAGVYVGPPPPTVVIRHGYSYRPYYDHRHHRHRR